MYKAIILAALVALSNAAFADEPVKANGKPGYTVGSYGEILPSEGQCPAGTKLSRGAQISIKADGSGDLVEHDTCEPLDDAAKDSNKTK